MIKIGFKPVCKKSDLYSSYNANLTIVDAKYIFASKIKLVKILL